MDIADGQLHTVLACYNINVTGLGKMLQEAVLIPSSNTFEKDLLLPHPRSLLNATIILTSPFVAAAQLLEWFYRLK